MKSKIQSSYTDNNCFFCGSDNNDGLKLSFYWDSIKKEAHTEYVPTHHFVGQGNILHGGIQTGLLDEIIGWTSYIVSEKMAVTTNLNTSFLQPLYISKEKIQVKSAQQPPEHFIYYPHRNITISFVANSNIRSSRHYSPIIFTKTRFFLRPSNSP